MVQLNDDLVERLDVEAKRAGQSRSAFIRQVLSERLAELELALEDVGWVRLGMEGEREFSREGLDRIMQIARYSYLKNPLINRGVEVQRLYVFGQGVNIRAEDIGPTVTWGINPGQAIFIDENLPIVSDLPEKDREGAEEAFAHMKLTPGTPIKGTKVDVVFLGSCTNGRISDFREVAPYIKGRKVAPGVKAIVSPGSQVVSQIAEQNGLPKNFRDSGVEWKGG